MFNFSFKKRPNTNSVVKKLIKALNLKICNSSIDEALENHPDYPSLLSISDCLTHFSISNQAIYLPRGETVTEFLFPFLAYLQKEEKRFVLVHEINNKEVIYSNEIENFLTIDKEEFFLHWDGIALQAEVNSTSGERLYFQTRLKYFLKALATPSLVLFILMLLIFGLQEVAFSMTYIALSLIKASGLLFSIMLLMKSFDSNNPFIENVCSAISNHDCNDILNSKAAKITEWLSWSEVGFFYFTGSLLSLIIFPSSIYILSVLNILAIPYTLYSLTYQYKNRKWCVLCCCVQMVLVLELLTSVFSKSIKFELSIVSIYNCSICFIGVIVGWAFLKPLLMKASQLKTLIPQLRHFTYNNELFNQILKNQPKFTIDENLLPINFGNDTATTTLTFISNPYCIPCAKVHKTLSSWLSSGIDFKFNIIFNTSVENQDESTNIAKQMIAIGMSSAFSGQKKQIFDE